MPTRKPQHGFTIVELMVTMSILGLMLFLVNKLFNDTSVAVTTSVQSSKTLAQSRSINEQLSNDAAAMVGPGDPNNENPGFIVIYQRRLFNVKMTDPQTLGAVTVDSVRSDQLVFIRDAEGLKSMTPSNSNGYGTSLAGQPGDRARVWYGQAQRTLSNGQDRTLPNSSLGEANAGLDSVANDFILGRQAMLFNPTDFSLASPAKVSVNPTAYTHAAKGYYNAVVSGSGFGAGAVTYRGLTDVTVQDYGPAALPGTFLYELTNPAVTAAARQANYLNTPYRPTNSRLRVNTAPDAADTDYASWAIAQGHAILAQSCSEVIIDFAADLNGDGLIDTEFGGQSDSANAPIWWYDGMTQPNLGNAANNGTWTSQPGVDQPQINSSVSRTFIFRADDDTSFDDAGGTLGSEGTAHSYWPYLIRIRYRLHDTRGRLTSNYRAFLRDGLDNDGDGLVDLADPDEDRIAGRWFERIISVPRP